jgi:hypothetical protein
VPVTSSLQPVEPRRATTAVRGLLSPFSNAIAMSASRAASTSAAF